MQDSFGSYIFFVSAYPYTVSIIYITSAYCHSVYNALVKQMLIHIYAVADFLTANFILRIFQVSFFGICSGFPRDLRNSSERTQLPIYCYKTISATTMTSRDSVPGSPNIQISEPLTWLEGGFWGVRSSHFRYNKESKYLIKSFCKWYCTNIFPSSQTKSWLG